MKTGKRGIDHLQKSSTKSGWTFGAFQRKIPGSNGTSEKIFLIFWTGCSKRKFVGFFSSSVIFEISLKVYSGK